LVSLPDSRARFSFQRRPKYRPVTHPPNRAQLRDGLAPVLGPDTVLVAAMTDGSYLLMAYPQRESAAFVARDDAGLLRQALAEAFGSSMEGGTHP
jgi:hypothetical protein